LRSELAYLAIPDQAHKYERDFCYFKIGKYFAVSCFQQVTTHNLKQKVVGDTRGTIQKSVCVLATRPLYSAIRSYLEPCTQVYFNQDSFSDTQILITLYESLTHWFHTHQFNFDSYALVFGPSLQTLVHKWRRNLLTLFKLFLLEKKVVFYGVPVGEMCETIVGIASLVPCLLSHSEDTSSTTTQYNESHSTSRQTNTSDDRNVANVYMSSNHPSPNNASDTLSPNLTSVELRRFGFPLELHKTTFISPYQSLPQLDFLNQQSSYFIGTSNALFTKENKILNCDVVVDVTNRSIELLNKTLSKEMTLTPMDIAYIDYIIAVVEKNMKQNANNNSLFEVWEGSNDWIREMFSIYLQCFLSSFVDADFGTSRPLHEWNNEWVHAWSQTQNCLQWRAAVNPQIVYYRPPIHPGISYQRNILQQVTHRLARVNNALTPLKQQLREGLKKIGDAIDQMTSSESPNPEIDIQSTNNNNNKPVGLVGKSVNVFSTSEVMTQSPNVTQGATTATTAPAASADTSERTSERSRFSFFVSRLSHTVNEFFFNSQQNLETKSKPNRRLVNDNVDTHNTPPATTIDSSADSSSRNVAENANDQPKEQIEETNNDDSNFIISDRAYTKYKSRSAQYIGTTIRIAKRL